MKYGTLQVRRKVYLTPNSEEAKLQRIADSREAELITRNMDPKKFKVSTEFVGVKKEVRNPFKYIVVLCENEQ